MSFWVYILRCSDGSYYVGHTDNLEQRMSMHNQGIGCAWTRRRRPVELLWSDYTSSRDAAISFERRIKGWTRAKKEALIRGDWTEINRLARPPHERPATKRIDSDENANPTVRPERSAMRVVDGRSGSPCKRPSTAAFGLRSGRTDGGDW